MLQLSQRSLTASDADGELFCDRGEELAAVERALDLGFNVYVSGASGSGKTSFLQRVRARRERSIFVNLARVDRIDGLIDGLAASIDPGINKRHWSRGFDPFPEEREKRLEKQGADRLGTLRWALRGESAPYTLLLDNLDPHLTHEMFGRQRDELWQMQLQWVVTGDTSGLDPPADSFFESSVHLEPLSPEAMRDLLLRRGKHGTAEQQEQMTKIANTLPSLLHPATPRRVISTARAVVLSSDLESNLQQLRDQQYSQHKLSSTARLVLDALYDVGPAHAGNEQLLTQVGATRSRVAQLLKELEEAQLVRSTRQGKRRVYAPALGESRPVKGATYKVR